MANPKSKTPASSPMGRPFNHSDLTENRENDIELTRSQSRGSSNRRLEERVSSDKIVPEQRLQSVNDEGVESPAGRPRSGIVRYDTPVPDLSNALRQRKQSYKLTYDPNRDPGNEYQVEKVSVSEYGDQPDDDVNDTATIADDVSLPVDHDDKSTLYHGERVDSVEFEENIKDETDNVNHDVFRASPLDTADTRAHTVSSIRNSQLEKSKAGDSSRAAYKVEKDLTFQSIETLKTSKSRTPKPLSPTDRGETNIIFKDINSRASVVSSHTFTRGLPRGDNETETRALTRQTDSIPPPNFKLNLFNRIKRNSTPKRLAKLNRFLNRTSERGQGVSVKAQREPVTSNVIESETTFVKVSQAARFERMSSTDSIRTHYDKQRKYSRANQQKVRSRERYENVDLHINKENINVMDNNKRNQPKRKEMDSIKQIVSKRKTGLKQQVVIEENKHYERSTGNAKKRAIDDESVDTTSGKATLAKRRQTGAKPRTRPGLFTDRNFGKNLDVRSPRAVMSSYIDSDDIFTLNEKKANLRQAQYINDDLKLVKRKVKDAEQVIRPRSFNVPGEREFKVGAIDTRPRSLLALGEKQNQAQRKTILSNINRNKIAKYNANSMHVDRDSQSEDVSVSVPFPALPATSRKGTNLQSKLPVHIQSNMNTKRDILNNGNPIFASGQNKQGKQKRPNYVVNGNQRNTGIKSVDIFNKALNKQRKPSITFKEVKHEERTDKMIVQPKIHKMKNTMGRDILNQTVSSHPDSSQANVANWLINSLNDDISQTTGGKTINNTSEHSKTRRNAKTNKPKLVVKLPRRKKRKSSGSLINIGSYMPLPKPRRRLSNKWNRLITQVGKAKGYESEIPILHDDSDDEDEYEPRPNTDTAKNRYPHYRRYEGDTDHIHVNYRNPAHAKFGRTNGALVKFFRNGDKNYAGLGLTINKYFRTFEQLLTYLSGRIETTRGVNHIFKWPEGYEVKSLRDFKNRCVYIVSSKDTLEMVRYGESKNTWTNKKLSAGKVRQVELGLFKKPPKSSTESNTQKDPPQIFSIVSNLNREKREKVILNPKTQQPFEAWLRDLSTPDMPVKYLFTGKPPHSPILSFTILFRELKHQNTFIVCGDEGVPVEKPKEKQKRQAPSSNSSTDSINESRNLKKKLPRQHDMGQIHENFENGRPMSTALSRYDYGPRYNPFPLRGPARMVDSRRRDIIEFEVDGEIKEFIPPSYFNPEDDGAKPDRLLHPEWVYGFRGRDARQNLIVLPDTGELVYYVAAIVVLHNKDKDSQRHYIKHNEEITCMTLHPNNIYIATGQLKGRDAENGAHIRIWDGINLSTYSVIGLGVFYGGILSIGFSRDDQGMFMCALDMSDKHVLSVWEWKTERIIARTSALDRLGKLTTPDVVHNASFYPDGPNTSILVTYGYKHIYFWKIFFDEVRRKEAKILRDRNSGIFEDKNHADHLLDDIPESVNCVAWLPGGEIVTGDTNGNLMVWIRDSTDAFTCVNVIQAHSMPVMSLCFLADGTLLSGAGSELKAWDSEAEFAHSKTRQIPEAAGEIRSIEAQTDGIDGRLYIGTANSAILDGSLLSKFKYIVQGHGQGVSGVVPHPFEPTFISAGQDQVVFKWSLVNHKLIWRSPIEAPSTCVAIDHKHELVAVGTGKGVIIFLNGYNGMHVATIDVGCDFIGCMSFSRDCQLLAIGCGDGSITAFEMQDKGQLFKNSYVSHSCHKDGVAHLDWSSDSRCIQSTDYNHDLIFWNVDTMQQIEITRLVRDVDWYTATCDMAYYMIGPWSNMDKGERIKSTCRSNGRDLMLVGDSRGRLRLYKFPCTKEKSEFRSVKVYSGDVTTIAFTPDTRSALTSGGYDAALIQWSVVDEL